MERYTFDREDLANRLSDGCIVGHTTPTSTKIWVRVAVAGTYTLIVSKDRIKVDPKDIGQEPISKHYLLKHGIHDPMLLSHDFQEETDKTHVFHIPNDVRPKTKKKLEPDTVYHYAIVADPPKLAGPGESGKQEYRRWRFGFEKDHCFKTPHISSKHKEVTFGLFSCHDPFKKGTSGIDLWDDFYDILNEYHANFVVGAGDQVYMDSTKEDIWDWVKENKDSLWDEFRRNKEGLIEYFKTIYRYVYRKYWSFPELRKVFRSFPMYMIWDDHEIMDGWGSYTDDELSDKLDSLFEWENKKQNLFLARAMYEAAQAVYVEYQHSHNPVNTLKPSGAPLFDYPFSQGDIGLYVLDVRGHRKFKGKDKDGEDINDGESILGKPQFSRFQSWIQSPETQKKKALFIITPVPIVHWHSTIVNVLDIGTVKDDFRDEWDHESNHKERNKLLNLVFDYSKQEGKPVVFLSGDVHCAAAFKLTRSGKHHAKAKIFQFTSSAITRPPAPKFTSGMVLDRGKLGKPKKSSKEAVTCFEKLLFVARHNFGLLRCKSTEDNGIEIWGHLYSSEGEENELILSRVKLS